MNEKPRKFWNAQTDKAILKFVNTKSDKEREKIYTLDIHPAMVQLVSYVSKKLVHVNPNLQTDLEAELMLEAWRLLLTYRYPQGLEPAPYAYFTRGLKHCGLALIVKREKIRRPFTAKHQEISFTDKGSKFGEGNQIWDKDKVSSIYFIPANITDEVEEMDSFNNLRDNIIEVLTDDIETRTKNATTMLSMEKSIINYLQTCHPADFGINDIKILLKKEMRVDDDNGMSKQAFFLAFQNVKRLIKDKLNLNVPIRNKKNGT